MEIHGDMSDFGQSQRSSSLQCSSVWSSLTCCFILVAIVRVLRVIRLSDTTLYDKYTNAYVCVTYCITASCFKESEPQTHNELKKDMKMTRTEK